MYLSSMLPWFFVRLHLGRWGKVMPSKGLNTDSAVFIVVRREKSVEGGSGKGLSEEKGGGGVLLARAFQ